MKKQFLEAGKIVNTHGIRGEVKIQSWSDSADFLGSFKLLYIDNIPYKIINVKLQKNCVIATLSGIDTIDKAIALKNKVVFIDRNDAFLDEGQFFIQDLIGLAAIDSDTGLEIGKIKDILDLPAGKVYVIEADREILVPGVPEFIVETNVDAGFIKIHLIEGM